MTSTKRREGDEEDGMFPVRLMIWSWVIGLIFAVIMSTGSAIMAAREANSGPVDYIMTIQDPSPEVNWYGWATVWCSHRDECKGIWSQGERPHGEYIVSEKMDRVRVGDSNDFRWQYRRTMVDVDEGKWAVEEFRYVKDMSGLISSPGFEDFGYLNVEDDKKVRYQKLDGLNHKNRAISKLTELIQHIDG